jgi:DnaJ domain
MPSFVIALIIVVGGLWLIRKVGRTPPTAVRLLLQKIGGGAMIAFAALLALRGQWNLAIGLFALGMGLIGKASLLPNGFNWRGASPQNGVPPRQEQTPPPQRGKVQLPKAEALSILGLKPGASAEDVKQAHKRLMKDFHPDKGGTDYLAAKINEAKDVLLS